jgi:hypothetical protein
MKYLLKNMMGWSGFFFEICSISSQRSPEIAHVNLVFGLQTRIVHCWRCVRHNGKNLQAGYNSEEDAPAWSP